MKKYLFLFLLIPLSSLAQEVPCRWETSQRGDVFDGIKKEARIYSYCLGEREWDISTSRWKGPIITKGYDSAIDITNFGDFFSLGISDRIRRTFRNTTLFEVVSAWRELNNSSIEEPEPSGIVNKVKDGVNRILNNENENDNENENEELIKVSIAFDNSPSVIYETNTRGYIVGDIGYVHLKPESYRCRNCKYSVVKNDKIVGEITSLELINLMKVKSSIQIKVSTKGLYRPFKASFSLRGSAKAINYALQ